MKSLQFLASRGASCVRARFALRAVSRSSCALLVALLVCGLGARAQNPQAVVPANESLPKGSINGRVLGDDGQPIPNATIIAFAQSGARGNNSAGATSDATGKFALGNLDPGAYSLNAFAPGYVLDADFMADPAERKYYYVGDAVTLRLIKGSVITGKVTDADGDPLVGARVSVLRVRRTDGRPVGDSRSTNFSQPRQTDDRGVYRIYGLRPGAYIIMAGGKGTFSFGQPTAYDADAPTYYPSTMRDTAVEVSVQAGQEMSGVDIRYRGEQGRAVSGTISTAPNASQPANANIVVSMKHAAASAPESFSFLQPGTGERGFSFEGLADGDYDLAAQSFSANEESSAAPSSRIQIRGADVTGVNLTLTPLGSLSGRLVFEAAKPAPDKNACQQVSTPRPLQTVIYARFDDPRGTSSPPFLFNTRTETTANDKGDFTVRSLAAGRYRPAVRLPDENFYVRAMELPSTSTSPKPAPRAATAATTNAPAANDPARQGFALRTGERVTGLVINIAGGAASLRGRLAAATEGESVPDQGGLRVHLVPAERAQADDVLRYGEAAVGSGGAFSFTNLAPGRYYLIARPADREAAGDAAPRPLAWDAATRAQLRLEAEAAGVSLELAPCQRAADFVLRYPAK
jgi:hypothetical protein